VAQLLRKILVVMRDQCSMIWYKNRDWQTCRKHECVWERDRGGGGGRGGWKGGKIWRTPNHSDRNQI